MAWLNEANKLKVKVFANSPVGWLELAQWSVKSIGLPLSGLHFVVEATGVYHGRLATYLFGQGPKVSVVSPAQVKFYGQSLGVRTKNDKKDSVILARYGMNERLKLWQPEAKEICALKALGAAMRKLVQICFGALKHQQPYQPQMDF